MCVRERNGASERERERARARAHAKAREKERRRECAHTRARGSACVRTRERNRASKRECAKDSNSDIHRETEIQREFACDSHIHAWHARDQARERHTSTQARDINRDTETLPEEQTQRERAQKTCGCGDIDGKHDLFGGRRGIFGSGSIDESCFNRQGLLGCWCFGRCFT